MNIIIARDDQTFGPYSKDQVAELIAQGELSPDDLGSWEGGEDWVSLKQLLSATPDSGGENEDDFDHEKMKQWEDVFVDDEEGFEDDDQFVDDQEDDPPAPPVQTSVPPSLEIAEDQVVPSVPRLAVIPKVHGCCVKYCRRCRCRLLGSSARCLRRRSCS